MDKKQLFQKQLLQSKIDENTKILSKLQNSYDELKLNSEININNTNISIITKQLQINNLLEEKVSLDNNKKLIKLNINNLTLNISTLEEDLKTLPSKTKVKLQQEQSIYNDEIERIENNKIEEINTNIENINNAIINKDILLKEIELLKTNIEIQNNVISTIQITCHSSRKDILESLQHKKQMKINLNTNINNCDITKNTIIDKINNLQTTILYLIEFKKLLVDADYEIEQNETNQINLNKFYTLFNIDNTISLNDKLILIDILIDNNKNQVSLFTNKLNKTKLINNIIIQNDTNNYTKTNTNKIITYKNNFKIEKTKLQELETLLEAKLNLYNNYEILIIDKINNELKDKLDILELDKQKAIDRLKIIIIRMNKEFESNKKLIKNKILQNNMDIQQLDLEMSNTTNNIKLLNISIEKHNQLNDEIIILENKIKKCKEIIVQSEADLLTLSRN